MGTAAGAPCLRAPRGTVRHARCDEIDLDAAVWTIPAEKMQMRKPHHVPLSTQAVAILPEIRSITGANGYVFPSMRSRTRPMSDNTLNAAFRRLEYSSDGKWSYDAIERALAHGDSDRVRAAYHRGRRWKERVAMAQCWSDLLDSLRNGATIQPFPEAMAG